MDNPPDNGPCEVTITAPEEQWLLTFAHQLVEDRLAAAAHTDLMRTTYRWAGEVRTGIEARVKLHTTFARVAQINERTVSSHPFDVPCVVSQAICSGNRDYLDWVQESVS